MTLPCPVCHEIMQTTETTNLIMCPRRKIHVPSLKQDIETVHAIYHLNSENRPILKVIEVLPYTFEIHDNPKGLKQTRIIKTIKWNDRKSARTTRLRTTSSLERENLITVPGTVNCQWDDPKQVQERVNMYMLFS